MNPPSSMHQLTNERLNTIAITAEIWSVGAPLSACVVFSLTPDALYIGKLCVTPSARGTGIARRLIDHASKRAKYHGKDWLELQVRIELAANQAAFKAMGFHEVGRTAHDGFDTPTSITFRRAADRAFDIT